MSSEQEASNLRSLLSTEYTLASRVYCMLYDLRVRNRYKTAASLEQVGGRVAGSRVIIGNHIFPAKLDPGIYVATALVHVGRVSSKFSLSVTHTHTHA